MVIKRGVERLHLFYIHLHLHLHRLSIFSTPAIEIFMLSQRTTFLRFLACYCADYWLWEERGSRAQKVLLIVASRGPVVGRCSVWKYSAWLLFATRLFVDLDNLDTYSNISTCWLEDNLLFLERWPLHCSNYNWCEGFRLRLKCLEDKGLWWGFFCCCLEKKKKYSIGRFRLFFSSSIARYHTLQDLVFALRRTKWSGRKSFPMFSPIPAGSQMSGKVMSTHYKHPPLTFTSLSSLTLWSGNRIFPTKSFSASLGISLSIKALI